MLPVTLGRPPVSPRLAGCHVPVDRRQSRVCRRRIEAALLRLAVKGRDLTVALPKFYVMTIDELPCVFFCGLVVREHELDCPADMTVLVKDVRSIFRHLRPPCPRHFRA